MGREVRYTPRFCVCKGYGFERQERFQYDQIVRSILIGLEATAVPLMGA